MENDKIATITISADTYRDLIKDSVTLQIVERYIKDEKYITKEDLIRILGIEEAKEGEE